ncbi:MAG: ribosome biogenesis GTPase Der [Firmicutes bacterium]|nr:ribosome biogenesis GTPase Der [Bacillota bacterium]MBO2520453.1 ribosome biogenesis GTPase Der [Bacillota bacterium]
MAKGIVAIVGRPNVGKSALFNRIAGRRLAIVEGEPGVTRDRIYAECQWQGRRFILVDTGGIDFGAREGFAALARRQAELAVEEADVILFVVDARDGLVAPDQEVAGALRRSQKPVLVVANKVDHRRLVPQAAEFYALGLGDPLPVSAEHGLGIADLLDRMIQLLPAGGEEDEAEDEVRVAVIGRPNVGKSSLVNRMLGEERSIVTEIPGTTRDALDSHVTRDGIRYTLIDTAGIRRRSRIEEPVERYSVIRALRAVDRADVCVLLLDATELVTEQDKRIAGYAHEAGKGMIIGVNKWDLVEKDDKTADRFEEQIREQLGFLQYAPILFLSAKTGQRVHRVFELAHYVANQHALRISTGRLNEVLHQATMRLEPPTDKGERLRIYYGTQSGVKPPTFVLFVNEPKLMHYSYLRYLENQLRENFGFVGTPIRFRLRKRE